MFPFLRTSPLAILLAVGLGSSACTVGVEIGRNDEVTRAVVLDVPARKRTALDLLFVVDNSSNMSSRQTRLIEGFDYFINATRAITGTLPDLHVGVISGDLGAGVFASQHAECSVDGDGGALLVPAECDGIDGNFLRRAEGANGLVDSNYEATLGEAFSCIAALGESGCDYEQPLEAMRIALGGELLANAGFLRPSAALGVVFLTDEDDCSASGSRIFDPAEPMLSGDAEWRCFSAGVRCGTDDDVFPPGWQADCVAREDSTYVKGITDYADFVRGLKGDPSDVFIAGIIGEPELVRVEARDDNRLSLEPACADASGEETFPGVRMRRFLDATRVGTTTTELDSSFESLCSQNTERGILDNAADRMRTAMGSTCLRGHVIDIDADTPGTQVDCYVSQVFPGREEPLAACDNRFNPTESSFFPCYTIEPGNDICSHEPTRLSLRVVRSATPDPDGLDAPIDARLRAACVIDETPVVGIR